MEYKFQVNLSGIIELLSNHLYSSPQVFIRELLQNGVDAIYAREKQEGKYNGTINIEVVEATQDQPPSLVFIDNGIGLTEEEIHRFLATIGQSSKKDDLEQSRQDFLGQFGIGLLSCFMVSDEIVVITQSIKPDSPTLEWRGQGNGTYTIRQLKNPLQPGTRVYLRCQQGYEEYFQPKRVLELAHHFGNLLPYPVIVSHQQQQTTINQIAPWQDSYPSLAEERQAMIDYAQQQLQLTPFDYIPLRSPLGKVEGVAYILPYSPSPATLSTHRVYLKGMLLSEKVGEILPEWAFFVKCVLNVQDLRPTASRESFYEDGQLVATRGILGQQLKEYLIKIAQDEPPRLKKIISLHFLAIKALAVYDDEFYRLFIDWLPFETSLGRMTLLEYKEQQPIIRYVPTVDQFRQIAHVAASQSIPIINGGYVYDMDLLTKLPLIFPDIEVEKFDATQLTHHLEGLSWQEREETFEFIRNADLVLQPFKCSAQIKKFLPLDLPALYSTGEEGEFQRNLTQSQEVTNEHWGAILETFNEQSPHSCYAELCFNYQNALIQKLLKVEDKKLLQLAISLLYTQSLLLGHHPLNSQEMGLLNGGLLSLIEMSIDSKQ